MQATGNALTKAVTAAEVLKSRRGEASDDTFPGRKGTTLKHQHDYNTRLEYARMSESFKDQS